MNVARLLPLALAAALLASACSAPGSPGAAAPAPSDAATPDPTTQRPTAPGPAASSAPPTAQPAPAASATSPAPSASTPGRLPGVVARGLVAPAPSAKVRPGTFALGDSFLLGSARTMTAAHVKVDAKVGRQFFQGITELRAVSRSGRLPRNVVVHLGTNGTVTTKHCENVVATVGSSRRLFLVTVIGPRPWMAPDVKVLKACAARHPDRVVLLDWAALAAPHPDWFGPDRVHPNPTGRKHYNALILGALKEYAV